MTYQFKNMTVEFSEGYMVCNGNRADYKDIVSVKNHRSEGHIYAGLFFTNSSIMQTIFQLAGGNSFVLEQKARSFYGIGTNGALKRKWRSMTDTLQKYVAPYIAANMADTIKNQGYIEIGELFRADTTGITQAFDYRLGKKVPADNKLTAENYERAEFDSKGYLCIYDKSGKTFGKKYAYLYGVGAQNAIALPALYDHLYKGKTLPQFNS